MAEAKKPVLIAVLLDRSGSMLTRRTDVIGSINALVQDQKSMVGQVTFMLITFSDRLSVFVEPQSLHEMDDEVLTVANYIPIGCTALLDAIASTISSIEQHESVHGAHEIFLLILTDGKENASQEFRGKKSEIGDLIEERKQRGWSIRFMSADFDAVEEAQEMRIRHSVHVQGPDGFRQTMSGHSQDISQFRRGDSDSDSSSGGGKVH